MKCNGKSEPMFLKKEDILVLPGIIPFIHAYCSDGECNKLRSEAQGMRP